jgi:hypothetical protein
MGRALRYAVLGLSHSAVHQGQAEANGACDLDVFARQATELCRWIRSAGDAPNTARAIAATEAKIRARDSAALRRNALDYQRLEDLQARQAARRANALRQRWFVLGRVIDAAMGADPRLEAHVLSLLRRAALRKDERSAVGL